MSAGGISNCCCVSTVPVSAAQPVPVDGGGGQPAPVETAPMPTSVAPASDPGVAAQPAPPPAEVVLGGGGTTYAPPEPTCCGTWIPEPTQQQQTTPAPQTYAPGSVDPNTGLPLDGSAPEPMAVPSGQTAPPEPQPVPAGIDGSGAPAPTTNPADAPVQTDPTQAPTNAPATAPATSLAEWPEWQAQFTSLGVSAEDLAKIGAANLTNQQLAAVYMTIRNDATNGTPGVDSQGQAPAGDGVPAWSPEWEQKFVAAGLKPEDVAKLKQLAVEKGADAATLQTLLDEVIKGGAADPTQQTNPGQQAGWSPEWEQKFKQLGMPDEIIGLYAQSGAPASGLGAAFDHASKRLEDFKQRGWFDKFTEEKVPSPQIWSMVLADKPSTDEELKGIYQGLHKANMPTWKKGLQGLISFFPGGELAQYAVGKKFISGNDIDRSSAMNIGFAALSGLAAFAAIKGGMNISRSLSSLKGGLPELGKVGLTTKGSAVTDAALGTLHNMSTTQRIAAWVPFTKTHQAVVGWGHAEMAAKSFAVDGSKLLAGKDGALKIAAVSQLFDDIKTGAMTVKGAKNAYLPALRNGAPMVLGQKPSLFAQVFKKAPVDPSVIMASKGMQMGGSGRNQLSALVEMSGQKLAADPSWLKTAPNLMDDIARLPNAHLPSIGKLMAGSTAQQLGVDGGMFSRTSRYLNGLAKTSQPEWYSTLASGTATQWADEAVQATMSGAASASSAATGTAKAATSATAGASQAASGAEGVVDDVAKAAAGDAGGAVSGGGSAATAPTRVPVGGTEAAPAGFAKTESGLIVPDGGTVRNVKQPTYEFGHMRYGKPIGGTGYGQLPDAPRGGLGGINVDEVIAASQRLDAAALARAAV